MTTRQKILVLLILLVTVCLVIICLTAVTSRISLTGRPVIRLQPSPTPDIHGVWLSAPLTRDGDRLAYCCQNLSWQQNIGTNLATYLDGQYVPVEWGGYDEGESWWRIPQGVMANYPAWDSGSWTVTFFWDDNFGPRPNGDIVSNPNP